MRLEVSVEKNFTGFDLKAAFSVTDNRIGVFGESGSGKSTLISLLAGLLTPDEGSISLDGDCLYSREKKIDISPEKRRMAIVFQQPHLFPHLNVKGNLLYGYKRCAPEHRKIDFASLVEVLKLDGVLKRGVNYLSGGEKQRVAIGRAILSNPRLLLMDEPLSALDDELKYAIIPYVNEVCARFSTPFLFVSHSMVEMRLMTDTVILLEKGRVIEQMTTEQLARRRMDDSRVGYINLLKLRDPRKVGGLFAYSWGRGELFLSTGSNDDGPIFELSSKDIILFRKHPEAISARNLLKCRVAGTFPSGHSTGVELDCGEEGLIAEISCEAEAELEIKKGIEVYAAIKSSAFRPLK